MRLHGWAVLPEPMLFPQVSSRLMRSFSQRIRNVALLSGRACILIDWFCGKSGAFFSQRGSNEFGDSGPNCSKLTMLLVNVLLKL